MGEAMRLVSVVLCCSAFLLLSAPAWGEEEKLFKPFILAEKGPGTMQAKVGSVTAALKKAGFEVVGTYTPYPTASIVAFTSGVLKTHGAASKHGGFGAVLRVSVTQLGNVLQVAYSNPEYMAHAYRMKGPLTDVRAALEKALGAKEEFGPPKGLTGKDLRKYHYMFGMEYFDDPSELGKFASHEKALEAVAEGLKKGRGGASQVYRVALPGKQETVFGVALTRECSGDKYIMSRIDFKPTRSTPHLPYEILVSGKEVFALFARFRIAINFPDLAMMGSNSFFSIMCAPGEIEDALKEVSGIRKPDEKRYP